MSGEAEAQEAAENELQRLRRELAECQQDRSREKEDFDARMLDIRQKTKDHMATIQEKTKAKLQEKDAQVSELEAAKAQLLSELSSLKAQQCDGTATVERSAEEIARADAARADAVEKATRETARADAAEEACASLRERLRELDEKAAQLAVSSGSGETTAEVAVLKQELAEAHAARDMAQADAQDQVQAAEAVRAQLQEQEARYSDLQEEMSKAKQETSVRIKELVDKAKDHNKQITNRLEAQVSESKQLQAKLDAQVAENKSLMEKYREVDDAYADQQEKMNKYKQLMAQANARIEDGDSSTEELKELISKLEQENRRLKERHQELETACTPPTMEQIAAAGGVLLTVEAENEDVWCLLGNGNNDSVSTEGSSATRRWWLSSDLDVIDKPIPMQRRWKGEVSALKAQMARSKKRNEELQEEFDAYRQKANAALQTGAAHSEEILLRERKFEQLGEQLQASRLDLQEAQSEKAKILEDLGDVRRRLQEASSQEKKWKHTHDVHVREAREAQDAALAESRKTFEIERDGLAQSWRERERSYLQELDLRRAQEESLDEEIKGLRARLANRPVFTIADTAVESDSEDGRGPRVPSSLPSRDGDAAGVPLATVTPPRSAAERNTASPLDLDLWRGLRSSPKPSPRPSARSEDSVPTQMAASANVAAVASSEASAAQAVTSEDGAAPGASERSAPQAHSLHASMARQDMASMRARVRQMEANLEEERQRVTALKQEKEALAKVVSEAEEQQRLQQVVGQHQQMEYIRNVFRKFVETLPAGNAEQEQLIPVLMTFFQFAPEEARAVQGKRHQSKSQAFWNPLSSWRG